MSMDEVVAGIKQAVESGGADPASNMRLQFVMQKARDAGVADAMLDRMLGMVAASAAPAPAPLGSAPVARVAAPPAEEEEEPELTEEDLAAMRQDVLDSIADSVERGGRDLSENSKLAFLLKRASAMGVADSDIEGAVGGPIPTAGGASQPPPVRRVSVGDVSAASDLDEPRVSVPASAPADAAQPAAAPPDLPHMFATDVLLDALMPIAASDDLAEMAKYQRSTSVHTLGRRRSFGHSLTATTLLLCVQGYAFEKRVRTDERVQRLLGTTVQ